MSPPFCVVIKRTEKLQGSVRQVLDCQENRKTLNRDPYAKFYIVKRTKEKKSKIVDWSSFALLSIEYKIIHSNSAWYGQATNTKREEELKKADSEKEHAKVGYVHFSFIANE